MTRFWSVIDGTHDDRHGEITSVARVPRGALIKTAAYVLETGEFTAVTTVFVEMAEDQYAWLLKRGE